ncbi:hypothetical protein WJX72_002305 [[Myrmecia] bisecta]|uniref:methionine--tRNA ligase n=1 Tax=[Myrmecia] bisecta TaxID=41462 RepID=A0AAW1PCK3_9CHLO
MVLILAARAGDPQALKCTIAAAGAAKDLQLKLVTSGSDGADARLSLAKDDELELVDPNAMARLVGGDKLTPASCTALIEEWAEWEESVLRPAAVQGSAAALRSALDHLQSALQGRQFLVNQALTLADVIVFATVLPLTNQNQVQVPAGVASYVCHLQQQAAVARGLEQLLSGVPSASLLSSIEHVSAASRELQGKLPIPGQRNILITSALPYVNNVPHLGNIIGCVLSADCYARFCRLRGYNCIYVCGTDEYGTATETKALEEDLTCQQICDKYHAIHSAIYDWFDIGFDKFGRTPTWQQTQIAQDIFKTLQARGQLVEQTVEQLYSEAAGKFLADRFVYGICPKCGYEDARGDQCDSCGNLLNPTELVAPRCKLTGTTPVLRQTKHLFLDLPQLSPRLQHYIDVTSKQGGWSTNCVQVTSAWMRDGLKVRCITRDLKWGTPVPEPGFEEKVFYVWFDAPIGYISITANYVEDWKAWWQDPANVELVQFMGKDNVPFHTVIFPSTLLGTGQDWTMMKNISVTEYLNYEGGKFSKSRGVGVFGNDAKETGIPVEVWRYYLLSNRPEQSDTDFKWSDLAARNNSELLANLGNFINRALSFLAAKFGSRVPAAHASKGAAEVVELGQKVAPLVDQYVAALEKIRIREAIKIAMSISAVGNKFIQDTQPWVVIKSDPEACGTLLAACVGLVALLAALVEPYMPSVTSKVLQQLALPASAIQLSDSFLARSRSLHTLVPAGHQIGKPEVLFRNIDDAEVASLRSRYAGSQSDRASAAAAPTTSGKSAAPKRAPPGSKAAGAGGDGNSQAKAGGTTAPAPLASAGDKAKPAAKGGAAAKPAEQPADISRIDLRVGVISKVWRHPDAESLYREEIDCGEAAPRQVVSGLVKFIDEAAMLHRRVVVVANLKPANMRGVKSHAMVLAATSTDGNSVELVEPPAASSPGERVSVEGYSGEPDEQLNPKKKVFEAVQPDLKTNGDCIACYKGLPLRTSQGVCRVASIVGGSIK